MAEGVHVHEELEIEGKRRFGRRGLLAGGLAALGASLLGKVNRASAADGDNVVIGENNFGSVPTALQNRGSGPSFMGSAGSFITPSLTSTAAFTHTTGLVGYSGRLGIFGAAPVVSSLTAIAPDFGKIPFGRIGVLGSSPSASEGESAAPVGVFGISGGGIGVLGASPPIDVAPGTFAIGVSGVGGDADVIAMRAEHTAGGLALDVLGKARFSTAGTGTFTPKTDSQKVGEPSVGSDSVIHVTLMDDPKGRFVKWVERQPGSGFVVHLNGKTDTALDFSYLVVEPGSD